MDRDLRLMCVLAHPDDESLGLGFTLAKYAAEGVKISLVTATRGERGWAGKAEENPGLKALGRIREAELRCAAEKLGLAEVVFLDYIDGDVDQADPLEAAEKIAGHMRRFRPQVVVAFDLWGIYGHPDHIAVTQFTQAGISLAANGDFRDTAGASPHQVQKFYLQSDTDELVFAIKDLMGGIQFRVDGIEREHTGWPDWAFTTAIDGTVYWEQVMQAIACHETQVAEFLPALSSLPEKYPPQVLSVQHFVRAFSLVNGGRRIETDLFEGLR